MPTCTSTTIFRRAALCAAVLAVLAGAAPAEPKAMTFTVDGAARKAIVYAPSKQAGSAPLVLAFHGHGDTASNYVGVDLQSAWPEAVVVYFQGLPTRDGLAGWQTERGQDGDRDLKLVDTAVASLRKTFKIDSERIYATGFSNGAHFTYLLWAERPSVFAAYAAVAGRIRPAEKPTEPKPLLHVGGRNDHQVDFADQTVAMETARKIDRAGDPTSCSTVMAATRCTFYESPNGTPVMTLIHPGGHAYPDGTSEEIVKFFKRFTLEPVKSAGR
ncbi:MAG TPA: PHB depolymerase family esterase [Bryobacteraceae bacterium]|nr:PHB depolymerase family esterase [Bryobacteraceae bacterium]